jgi:hypothetical protein
MNVQRRGDRGTNGILLAQINFFVNFLRWGET